jgi:copper transporter 1
MDMLHSGMDGMSMPPKSSTNGSTMMMDHNKMMHMTFFWGNDALILFNDWPAGKPGNYLLALFMVFAMSVLIELLSYHTRFIKPGSNPMVLRLVQTLLHVLRVGLAYLVMLALMSFNGGVFLVAVLGHALGFFFCNRSFKKPLHDVFPDPMAC